MEANTATDLQRFSTLLHEEINVVLRKAGLISMLLGFGCGGILLVIALAGLAKNLEIPLAFSTAGGVWSALLWLLAKKKKMRGWLIWAMFLPFISLPTFFFLVSHYTMPAGSASYITGPMSYLYFHLIIMTGFVFDPKLSVIAGIITAIGYQVAFMLGQEQLAAITAHDPTLQQDLCSPYIFSFKSIMMVFGGVLVAGLSMHFKKLLGKILREEQEKQTINRLFGQYVSREVREKIISEKKGVIGETRNIAVLFSDIRSFSTYCEKRSPEGIVGSLNEYFERMVDAITKNGGTVDKFVGDAIMATFGGVLELEQPCDSALEAAIAMRKNLKKLNVKKEEDEGGEACEVFENGIGIHYGEVLQGTIGSRDRKEFTVIGDSVNVAARVEGLTKNYAAYKIIVTGSFVDQLSSKKLKDRCKFIENVKVKGKTQDIPIYGVKD